MELLGRRAMKGSRSTTTISAITRPGGRHEKNRPYIEGEDVGRREHLLAAYVQNGQQADMRHSVTTALKFRFELFDELVQVAMERARL